MLEKFLIIAVLLLYLKWIFIICFYPLMVKCPQKVGRVKYYPVIERVRYCTGLFPFNRDLILLLL